MTDLHCTCGYCGDPITRTEAIVAKDLFGGLSAEVSCLDCAIALTLEPCELAEEPVYVEDN